MIWTVPPGPSQASKQLSVTDLLKTSIVVDAEVGSSVQPWMLTAFVDWHMNEANKLVLTSTWTRQMVR